MKFKNDVNVAYVDEPYYALFDGGYIDPHQMLVTDDANRVQSAIELIENFIEEAKESGYIEIM